MKIKNILSKVALSVLLASTLGVTSCNYLDVVPPEQVSIDDAMKTHNNVLGFLYSCYSFSLNNVNCDVPYGTYNNDINACADEMLNPNSWATQGSSQYILYGTLSPARYQNMWHHNYSAIGQCLTFMKKLVEFEDYLMEREIVTRDEYDEFFSECQALMAYYHFILWRRYGPIPILTELPDMGISSSEMTGRLHVDYVCDYICDQLDQAAEKLPAWRDKDYRGRFTSVMCKAIKAKMLHYAASPLYNGSFPWDNFQNTNFETPGYGKELVSRTYDESKWRRALEATNEAIELAVGAGRRELYNESQCYEFDNYATSDILDKLYIPGDVDEEFKEAVFRMGYLHYNMEGEGNHEFIFHTDSGGTLFGLYKAAMPRNYYQNSNKVWCSGWCGQAPTLNQVEAFLTKDGYLPSNDPNFVDESEWFKSAGLPEGGAGRDRIINLCMNREPRFYAWVGFDGGDYLPLLANGEPVHINMLDPTATGYDRNTNNNSVTGFLCKKYVAPGAKNTNTMDYPNFRWTARGVIRLGELYLNRAECNARLGNTQAAVDDVNKIRERAGAALLTNAHLAVMPILDWVMAERRIEFFNEGMRWFDVLRNVEGEKYFSAGKRRGLNAGVPSPTFEEFNTPMSVPYNYTFSKKLYLYPIPQNEVYSNPQIVQNPGY